MQEPIAAGMLLSVETVLLKELIKGVCGAGLGALAGAGLVATSFFAIEALMPKTAEAQSEFRFPPATPVTCKHGESKKIVDQINDYSLRFGREMSIAQLNKSTELMREWDNRFMLACYRMSR